MKCNIDCKQSTVQDMWPVWQLPRFGIEHGWGNYTENLGGPDCNYYYGKLDLNNDNKLPVKLIPRKNVNATSTDICVFAWWYHMCMINTISIFDCDCD